MYNIGMNRILTLYHGSRQEVGKPVYGQEKRNNDYGLGFYCTMDIELAREWSAADPDGDGFVNEYRLDETGLEVLDLNQRDILTWISILLDNRTFLMKGRLAAAALEYLRENFLIDYSGYDAIFGWRADDSYFAFAEDFLNGALSIQALGRAMRLGNLGMQYVLKREKAFSRIEYRGAFRVDAKEYHAKRMRRDREARDSYLYGERFTLDRDDLFITDIMRKGIKRDDPRIR